MLLPWASSAAQTFMFTADFAIDQSAPLVAPWIGSTWSFSGGRALNTPVLGAERVTNGDFAVDASWTKGSGWTISTGAAHAAAATGTLFQGAGIAGRMARLVYTILNRVSGSLTPNLHNTALTARSTNGTFTEDGFWGGSANLNFIPSTATLDIDDVSVKLFTTSELFALAPVTPTSDIVLRVKLHALATGSAAGLVLCLDSTINPQNYAIMCVNNRGVRIEKVVGGAYSIIFQSSTPFTADAEFIASKDGTNWRFLYNNIDVLPNFTIADAGIVSNTLFGLFSTDPGNTFDDFSLVARTVGGPHTPITDWQLQIFPLGDSKTAGTVTQSWPPLLNALVTNSTRFMDENPSRLAASGNAVIDIKNGIDAKLTASTTRPTYALINLGVNDVNGDAKDVDVLGFATWEANYGYILDAVHTKWPTTLIYLMRPGKRGDATIQDKLNRIRTIYIPDVISTRSTWAFLGPNESIFLENGDDYTTYTSDGIHPTPAGYALTAAQWQIALGL